MLGEGLALSDAGDGLTKGSLRSFSKWGADRSETTRICPPLLDQRSFRQIPLTPENQLL